MNYILKIDYKSGIVESVYDFRNLVSFLKKKNKNIGVLNGVSAISKNLFLITGKNWPNTFIVELI